VGCQRWLDPARIQALCRDEMEWPSDGAFGFIWGCVWGDDASWKVQYLDLSRDPASHATPQVDQSARTDESPIRE